MEICTGTHCTGQLSDQFNIKINTVINIELTQNVEPILTIEVKK